MRRLALLIGWVLLLSSPAMAISAFHRQWKREFVGKDADEKFKKLVTRTGCNTCHVKGAGRGTKNEYGEALDKYLDAKDFSREWIKNNPEEARKRMLEGFNKANEMKLGNYLLLYRKWRKFFCILLSP